MTDLAEEFLSLPAEYQKVLSFAQEFLKIKVTLLQELKGGQTGASLFLVSVSKAETNEILHLVFKLDHKSNKSGMDELERHRTAVEQSPGDFAKNHIAGLAFERIELDGSSAIFYDIAGQSLNNYRPLASYQQQDKLERLFETTSIMLLSGWNKNPIIKQAVHPQKVLSSWLGYRLNPGGNIECFLEDNCKVSNETPGILIQGNLFPNPYMFAQEQQLWNSVRPIDILTGFQHGDLNIGNILAKFEGKDSQLTGYYLIDFALFKPRMPLLYDNCYLEMSYLLRELTRVSMKKWIDFVTNFANEDIIDPQSIPIELAGICAVINSGRKIFAERVKENYLSLSDDLWGQYWLAGVSAGLNYCNKTIISSQERLAGFIFAAAHLKRYHSMFGVPLPAEVKNIDIENLQPTTFHKGKNNRSDKSPIRNNLPPLITPFIGRNAELEITSDMLQREDVRLLSLTGPGGTGKTRLGIQLASYLMDNYNDGVFFVDLSAARDSGSLFASVARMIGLREISDRNILDEIKKYLLNRKMLILLDNFEQLTAASPDIHDLLLSCPQLKLIATTREPLRLRGEQIFPVPPLQLPDISGFRQAVSELMKNESIQFFAERAQSVKPDFKISETNITPIIEICSRLDGLPLAIELAAARMNVFSPEALLKRMDNRLKLLKGGPRDLPARQQTLRDTIDWSYEMLSSGEQKLFALLSVFPDCTYEQVEAVAEKTGKIDNARTDIMDLLSSLIDKSLIRVSSSDNGNQRLKMLETIREYASEKLEADPEFRAVVYLMHASYFVDFAQVQWKRLTGNERDGALYDLETEIQNIRVSWKYWLEKKDIEQLQKLTDCLWLLYDARGWLNYSVELTNDLLNVLSSAPSSPERAVQEIMLQMSLGRVLMALKGCTREVEEVFNLALELCQKYGEIPQSFAILRALASFYVYMGRFQKSAALGEQILSLAGKLNNPAAKTEGHLVLGYSLIFSGELAHGIKELEEALSAYKPEKDNFFKFRFGNNPGVISHTTISLCLWMMGFPVRSLFHSEESIAMAGRLNYPYSEAYALFHGGLLHLWRQEPEITEEYARKVLSISEKHDFPIWKAAAHALHGVALVGMKSAGEGLDEIELGINLYTELKTPPVFWPLLLSLRAGSLLQAGKPAEGSSFLNEAIEIIGQDSGNPLLGDFYRQKGEILRMISADNREEAETLFREAIRLAKKQNTLMFEINAALSLHNLLENTEKSQESLDILSRTYNKFTEGHSSIILVKTKQIIEGNRGEQGGLIRELNTT